VRERLWIRLAAVAAMVAATSVGAGQPLPLAVNAASTGEDVTRAEAATLDAAVTDAAVTLDISALGKTTSYHFSSLTAAVEFARSIRNRDPSATLSFTLEAGVHHIHAPILFGPELSGTPQHPTVIRAKAGTHPELRGSMEISPVWTPFKDGIWVAPVDTGGFDQLWVDGRREILARYPNFDPAIAPFGGYAADALSISRASRWKHPEDGDVRALHNARWGGVVFRILGANPDATVRLGEPLANNRATPPNEGPHPLYRMVEGMFEELDAPGEWFFDRRERLLYYKPEPGVDLHRAKIEITTASSLLRFVGSADRPAHDFNVTGLAFDRTRDTIFDASEPLLRSDWTIARDGAVFIEDAENVEVRNSDFHDLGGQGVFVSGHARRIQIRGNSFRNLGGTAISFVGSPRAVRDPLDDPYASTPLDRLDRTPGPASEEYPQDSDATDNLIHDIGTSDLQAAGVEVSMSMNITISHNTIYAVPRAGINIGDGTWGGHTVAYNDVFDTVLHTADHGAFNAWGRDRYWRSDRAEIDKVVSSDPRLPFLDAIAPTIIRNNRFQSDHGWDIDLDDGATNYRIFDNLLLSGGLKLREGYERVVYNNLIINNSFHPHVWLANSDDVFERNIVMSPYQPILMEHWGKNIDRNLFTTRQGLDEAHHGGTDAHSIFGPVKFVSAATGDFRVRPDAATRAIGFHDFAMDFGVTSTRLRRLAQAAPIPELISTKFEIGATTQFLGAKVKSVETLGEQSAAGLAEASGVLILSVDAGSPAELGGLKAGDVIVGVENDQGTAPVSRIEKLPDLLAAFQARKWLGTINLKIQRNQAERNIRVTP
jgi:hypothetical protein